MGILVCKIFLFLSRNSEYQDDEQFGFMHDPQRVTADARNYDPPVSSRPELVKQDIPESTPENQYVSSLSFPDTNINNIQQSAFNWPFVVDLNARNLPSVPSETVITSQFHELSPFIDFFILVASN